MKRSMARRSFRLHPVLLYDVSRRRVPFRFPCDGSSSLWGLASIPTSDSSAFGVCVSWSVSLDQHVRGDRDVDVYAVECDDVSASPRAWRHSGNWRE